MDALKSRIESQVNAALSEGERAEVRLGSAQTVIAYACEICWTKSNGLTERTGFESTSLDEIESWAKIQVEVHKRMMEANQTKTF